jgi:hypothetical protein
MPVLWHDMPKFLPADGSSVWIRRTSEFATPVLATWDLATLTFTAISTYTWNPGTTSWDPSSETLQMPWYAIARWRIQ